MSRTIRHKVDPGTDWWSRRPFSTWITKGSKSTKWWKQRTHRIERKRAKEVDDG